MTANAADTGQPGSRAKPFWQSRLTADRPGRALRRADRGALRAVGKGGRQLGHWAGVPPHPLTPSPTASGGEGEPNPAERGGRSPRFLRAVVPPRPAERGGGG